METIAKADHMVGDIPRRDAVQRILAGDTLEEVATDANVSRQRISQVFAQDHGGDLVEMRKRKRREITDPKIVASFVERPRSVIDIARDLGTSPAFVTAALNEAGYTHHKRLKMIPLMRKLTPDDIERAVELYDGGSTYREIAEGMGVHAMTMFRHLRDAGIESRARGRYSRARVGITPVLETDALVQLFDGGMSIAAIARMYGVSFITIRRRLAKAGCDLSSHQSVRVPIRIPIDEAAEMYRSGSSIAVVADAMGVSPTTARNRLSEHGVEFRKNYRLHSDDL